MTYFVAQHCVWTLSARDVLLCLNKEEHLGVATQAGSLSYLHSQALTGLSNCTLHAECAGVHWEQGGQADHTQV